MKQLQHNDLVAFLQGARLTATDETAVKAIALFEEWKPDTHYLVGDRRTKGDILYKCKQAHDSQAQFPPELVPSLWDIIDETHAGTLEDPIPASRNMEYTKGLYYLEDGTVYLMNREGMEEGEKVTLAYLPSELTGSYFVKIE